MTTTWQVKEMLTPNNFEGESSEIFNKFYEAFKGLPPQLFTETAKDNALKVIKKLIYQKDNLFKEKTLEGVKRTAAENYSLKLESDIADYKQTIEENEAAIKALRDQLATYEDAGFEQRRAVRKLRAARRSKAMYAEKYRKYKRQVKVLNAGKNSSEKRNVKRSPHTSDESSLE